MTKTAKLGRRSRGLLWMATLALAGCGDDAAGTPDAGACAPTGDAGTIASDGGTAADAASAGDAGFAIVVDSPDFEGAPSAAVGVGDSVLKLNDAVYQAPGFGNTFLVVTPEGNVVIDTSLAANASGHRSALRAIDDGPVRYIILTHAHADHTGGVDLWKEPDTEVIAQASHVEFVNYQRRLQGVLQHHATTQFPFLFGGTTLPYASPDAEVVNDGGEVLASILFDAHYEFRLGGLTFQIVHTPGETYDGLTVWIPQLRIAFTGDNFYGPFPNLYTLRGTKPRWALDYVASLERVMSWNPAIVAPSHEQPVYGDAIAERLGRYRDAILYVHDETVRGMNAGKDVFTLMQEIRLPARLAVAESYGNLPWSIRGIYEGYLGWFDGNAANMYATPPSAVYPELVELAGGASAVAARAQALVDAGDAEKGIRMADVALAANADDEAALRARLSALQALRARTRNLNEGGWLDAAIADVEARLP